MTNREVYDIGRRIESFNYVNQYDLDNVYIGYLIQIENTIYQVIVNQYNIIVNPDEQAEIFGMAGSDGNKSFVNGINSSFPIPDNTETRNMIPDIDPFELISMFDRDGNTIKDESENNVNSNLIDFNRPW
jgi:hypothetical protein